MTDQPQISPTERRIRDAALSLVLRTLTLPLGVQITLRTLISRIAKVTGTGAVLHEVLSPTYVSDMWDLLEVMGKTNLIPDATHRYHASQLRRLDMSVVPSPVDSPSEQGHTGTVASASNWKRSNQ